MKTTCPLCGGLGVTGQLMPVEPGQYVTTREEKNYHMRIEPKRLPILAEIRDQTCSVCHGEGTILLGSPGPAAGKES